MHSETQLAFYGGIFLTACGLFSLIVLVRIFSTGPTKFYKKYIYPDPFSFPGGKNDFFSFIITLTLFTLLFFSAALLSFSYTL